MANNVFSLVIGSCAAAGRDATSDMGAHRVPGSSAAVGAFNGDLVVVLSGLVEIALGAGLIALELMSFRTV